VSEVQGLQSALVASSNFNLTEIGLTITGDLEYDEWFDLMRTLVRLETAFQFAIGDALLFGEARYGEKYAQAMEATGLSYQALANMVWVARKVPMQHRNAELSWTHHRVVASVDGADQTGLLEMAQSQGMSATDLQHHISGKPERTREIVNVPPGISATEAASVLEQYANTVAQARSGDAPVNESIDDATLLSCILCDSCPYKTRKTTT